MYEGYLTYDGVEVVNLARTMTYVENGVGPSGANVDACVPVCDLLSTALGQPDYRTPLLDRPPWYDPDDPATEQFAGVLPLEVTGTEGTTRSVTMIDAVAGGAKPSRPVYGPRTIAVTGLLLGSSTAGVQAGLSWLTSTLAQDCTNMSGCAGADLTGLTECPPIATNQVDMSQPQRLQRQWIDLAQLDTSGVVAPDPVDVLRNWCCNPSAEYGVAGLSPLTFLNAAGVPENLPTGTLTRIPVDPTTSELWSGDWAFHVPVPPSQDAGPLYETHWTCPVPADQPGGTWSLRFVDSGINAVARWRVLDEDSRVLNGGFEDGLEDWTADDVHGQARPAPEVGEMAAAEGAGYASLTVLDATTDPEDTDPPPTVVLLTQEFNLPTPMGDSFGVEATAQFNLPTGGSALLRVSQFPGREGATAQVDDPDPAAWALAATPADITFDPTQGATLYVTVEVPVGELPGTVVNVDDVAVRLVYLASTSTVSEVPDENVLEYVQPDNTSVRLSVTIGTDQSGATTAEYDWDAVRWSPGPWTTPDEVPSLMLGDAGTFEDDPGWAQQWEGFGGAPDPVRDNQHAFDPASGGDGEGWSLLARGTGLASTESRYAVVDISSYITTPGTYTLRGWIFVPDTATADQGISVYQYPQAGPGAGETQLGRQQTAVKNQWTPITVTFTAADPGVDTNGDPLPFVIRLYIYGGTGFATNQAWLDNLDIIAAAEWPEGDLEPSWYFDGDTAARPGVAVYRWDGQPGLSTSTWSAPVTDWWRLEGEAATIRTPVVPWVCDDVRIVWTVDVGDGGSVDVTPAAIYQGATYEVGSVTPIESFGTHRVITTGTGNAQMVVHDPPGPFTPVLEVTGQPGTSFRVRQVQVFYRPQLPVRECLSDYWRTFPEVVCVEGPTILEKVIIDCDGVDVECLQVEWTWVSGSAFRYGVDRALVSGLSVGGGDQPVYRRFGVTVSNNGVISAQPECLIFPAIGACSDNPCSPGFIEPPAPPAIEDPTQITFEVPGQYTTDEHGVTVPVTREVNDMVIGVPPNLVPSESGGVFTFTLVNDGTPKLGVMIRVWDDALPTYEPGHDFCLFAYEYRIDYIAPNAVMTLSPQTSGRGQRVESVCPGAARPDNASGMVRGNYGGPLLESVARCHRRYAIRVQWLAYYPTTCPPEVDPATGQPNPNAGALWSEYQRDPDGNLILDDETGEPIPNPQGDLSVNLSIARREG